MASAGRRSGQLSWTPALFTMLCFFVVLCQSQRMNVSEVIAAEQRVSPESTVRDGKRLLPRPTRPKTSHSVSTTKIMLLGLLILSGDIHCNPGPFRVQCYNARSLLNKVPELKSDLACNSPDALCVCETWLSDSVSDHEIFGPEFAVFRRDRSGRGGGVLVAVKRKFSPVRRADLEAPNSELVWTELNCRGGKLLLGSL